MSQPADNAVPQSRNAPGETPQWPVRMQREIDSKVLSQANAWKEAQATPSSMLEEFALNKTVLS